MAELSITGVGNPDMPPGAKKKENDIAIPPLSLTGSLRRSIDLIASGSPSDAVPILADLQKRIAAASLFSSNETVEDVSSHSLPLLSVEYHLGTATLQQRTGGGGGGGSSSSSPPPRSGRAKGRRRKVRIAIPRVPAISGEAGRSRSRANRGLSQPPRFRGGGG